MDSNRLTTLKRLSEEYHDLNGTQYDVLEEAPTPLEFSRLVHIARPVLIKESAIPDVDDHRKWSKGWLSDKMGYRKISVAVTPNGRADAVTRGPDNKLYFAEPYTDNMTMRSFLDTLSSGQQGSSTVHCGEVHYLQSQNGNMFSATYFDMSGNEDPSEFEPLREFVPSEIPWCSEALDKSPDAVNLWIGDENSVTSIHSDPYENIYTVIRGSKHFTLLPPTEGWCLQAAISSCDIQPILPSSEVKLIPSPPSTPLVRWSSVADPTAPGALPAEAHPIHITVKAGETLYLPAGWWHYVRQEGFTVAANYWYDMEGRGMSWVWLNFLRGTEEPPLGNDEEPECGGAAVTVGLK
ncbi:Clavaminate synthase-like protein [Cerioporus squamosus]|nr:Clavaminate synthase-like protein [Cerioporus squamosus]